MEPETWLRNPFSLYSSLNAIPDLPSCNDVSTSAKSLPMLETIPIPVTTTRFIGYLIILSVVLIGFSGNIRNWRRL